MQKTQFIGHKRFITESNARYQELLNAAEQYTYRLPKEVRTGLLLKPLDAANHHVHYLRAIYGVLNVINKLHLPGGSTIVDAGAGPGWLAEQLLLLGYRVILLEPSQDMLDIARLRIERAATKWEIDLLARAEFVQATVEHLPSHLDSSGSCQAVLFHEAWHHVIDEERAARNVYSLLAPGGQMAVLTEGRWIPGDRNLETLLEQEMEVYGTLESPFTRDYMHFVLESAGFTEVNFYHAINGLFRADEGKLTIEEVAAEGHEKGWNNCIARRPKEHPHALNPLMCNATLMLQSKRHLDEDRVSVTVNAVNTGTMIWRANAERDEGLVTLGMMGTRPAGTGEKEVNGRGRLPNDVKPGETVSVTAEFRLSGAAAPFAVSLVAEGTFWFTERLVIEII